MWKWHMDIAHCCFRKKACCSSFGGSVFDFGDQGNISNWKMTFTHHIYALVLLAILTYPCLTSSIKALNGSDRVSNKFRMRPAVRLQIFSYNSGYAFRISLITSIFWIQQWRFKWGWLVHAVWDNCAKKHKNGDNTTWPHYRKVPRQRPPRNMAHPPLGVKYWIS